MNRLPFVSEEPADPVVRDVFERLRRRWKGAPVLHLYRLIAWAPGLLPPWMDFGHAMRFKTAAPAGLRELMVVRSGRLLRAEYEWQHHWAAALEEGVSEEKLLAQAKLAKDDGERQRITASASNITKARKATQAAAAAPAAARPRAAREASLEANQAKMKNAGF